MIRTAFSKAGAEGQGSSSVLDAIFAERPDLRGQPHVVSANGINAHTFIFEKEVFKAPRDQDQVARFEDECRIMSTLKAAGLPVAEVTHVGRENHFFGQARLEGAPLDERHLRFLAPHEQRAIAADIAAFMKKMSDSFSPSDAAAMSKSAFIPTVAALEEAFRDRNVMTIIDSGDADLREALLAYAQDLEAKKMVFMHTDLNPQNILIDSRANKVTGIIDFGLCNYGAPEFAFCNLYKNYDASFVNMIAEEYEKCGGQKVTYRDALLCRLAYDVIYLPGDIAAKDKDGGAKLEWRKRSIREGIENYEDACDGADRASNLVTQHFLLP